MDVRPVIDSDLPAIAKIALANGDQDGANSAYVRHQHRNGRFLVAVAAGEPVGYCATRRIGDATMLCDLFVDPARQSGGVGRTLLGAAFADAGERFTFASRDRRALPLYVRFGMTPRWPLLYLSGPPIGEGALRAERVPPSDAAAAELGLTGTDRIADYAYWGAPPGGTGLVVRDDGAIVAAGAATPDRLIHLVTAPGADPAATLTAALAGFAASRITLALPGPHPALPILLDARWRIEEYDHHMAGDRAILDPGSVLSPSMA